MTRNLLWTGVVLASSLGLSQGWERAFGATPADASHAKRARAASQDSPINPAAAQEAIEKALAGPAEVDFVDTPLVDVLSYLQDYHRIPIRIDLLALDKAGIKSDIAITRTLKRVSLASVLDLLLRDLQLTYTLHAEVLLVTTPEGDQEYLTAKVYDVADLVGCRDEKGEAWDDFDSLIDAITKTVQAKSWDKAGGKGSLAPLHAGKARLLTVSQTYRIHKQIAKFLDELRAAAKNAPMSKGK